MLSHTGPAARAAPAAREGLFLALNTREREVVDVLRRAHTAIGDRTILANLGWSPPTGQEAAARGAEHAAGDLRMLLGTVLNSLRRKLRGSGLALVRDRGMTWALVSDADDGQARDERTRAAATPFAGTPAAHGGFKSARERAIAEMGADERQVLDVLSRAPAAVHEVDLLESLKRIDSARWGRRSVRSLVVVLLALRAALVGTDRGLYDGPYCGQRYWMVSRAIKPAAPVEIGPPSDACVLP